MKQRSIYLAAIVLFLAAAISVILSFPTQRGLDLVGGVRGVFRAEPQPPATRLAPGDMQTALEVLQRRVNKLGVSEAQVQQKGSDQVIVEIPLSPSALAHHMTAQTAMANLMNVVKPAFLQFVEFPQGINVLPGKKNAQGEETFVFSGPAGPLTEEQAVKQAKTILTGRDLLPDASPEVDPAKQGYAVSLHFDDRGADIFFDYTSSHIGKYFGVVLDGRLITYPVIESAIPGGRGQISGGFASMEDAQHLATLLNAGALPVKLQAVQTSLIEATLGASAVRASVLAGVAGLLLVIIFMWLYYRLPGFLASIALLIYGVYTFGIYKAIPVTLTLPGIAGFILSVGMAVDANILIFERMKEELRDGRTLRAAIEAGFNRAMSAILDSNACTLIACAVLGFYGTGPVKGFAVTLAIGVIVSLFTAVTVTRTLLHLLDNVPSLQKPEYFGIAVQWMGQWAQGRNIIGRRAVAYGISLAVIIPGLIFLCAGQLRLGVDFTGGNEWIVQAHQINDRQVVNALRSAGLARDQYTLVTGTNLDTGERMATVHTKPGVMTTSIEDRALGTLHAEGVKDARTGASSEIAPLIGREMELNALKAILIASILIVLFLSVRFAGHEGFKNGFKYGICAIIAMLHDVFVVVGLFAIFGYFLQIEVDMNFVTALLTIIGFSVHDTIVIFDRVRENMQKRSKTDTFESVFNRSIVQTAARSINTSFTVVLVLVALVIFGDPVIRWFNVALLIGIISGTYSSIFNASPLVIDWQIIKRRRELAAGKASGRPMVASRSGVPLSGETLRKGPVSTSGASLAKDSAAPDGNGRPGGGDGRPQARTTPSSLRPGAPAAPSAGTSASAAFTVRTNRPVSPEAPASATATSGDADLGETPSTAQESATGGAPIRITRPASARPGINRPPSRGKRRF